MNRAEQNEVLRIVEALRDQAAKHYEVASLMEGMDPREWSQRHAEYITDIFEKSSELTRVYASQLALAAQVTKPWWAFWRKA